MLALTHSLIQIERFWESKPIMWLKTTDWFEFCRKRIFYLMRAQGDVVHRAPNNLGTVTTVLVYLMKTVNSTPKLLNPWLREALQKLNMAQVQGRFGMLFLHSWDPTVNRKTPLEELDWEDEIQMLIKMRVESELPIQLRHKQHPIGNPPSIHYPLGSHPCWADVKTLMRDHPYQLMQLFEYNEDWDAEPEATTAFIKMTNHLLMAVLNTHFRRPRSEARDLKEAMEEWSYLSLVDTMNNCSFEANNSSMRTGDELQSDTRASRFDRTFRMMCKDFFPPLEATRPKSGPWASLWKRPGYISWYHGTLRKKTATERRQITEALETIFHNLQCLPVHQVYTGNERSGGKVFDKDKKDNIRMVTNPRWYSLEHIVLDRAEATTANRGQQPPRKPGVTNTQRRIEEKLMRMEGLAEEYRKGIRDKRREKQKENRNARNKNKRDAPKVCKVF